MKIFTLALLLLPSAVLADCIPWEIQLSNDTLKGCKNDLQLYKQRQVRAMFPDGFFEDVYPAGNGGCGQSTSCDPAEFLLFVLNGLTECWPLFDEPVRSEGIWSQTVHNQSPMPKYKECKSTIRIVAGPIECVENPVTMARTWTVPHSCPSLAWEDPLPPIWTIPDIGHDAPCSWGTFLPVWNGTAWLLPCEGFVNP